MKLSQSIQIYALMAGFASAIPSPSALTKTIMLSNGTMTLAVEVESGESLDAGAILGRSSVDCKGSGLCTNGQEFKDQCLSAYSKIEDTIYTTGGT